MSAVVMPARHPDHSRPTRGSSGTNGLPPSSSRLRHHGATGTSSRSTTLRSAAQARKASNNTFIEPPIVSSPSAIVRARESYASPRGGSIRNGTASYRSPTGGSSVSYTASLKNPASRRVAGAAAGRGIAHSATRPLMAPLVEYKIERQRQRDGIERDVIVIESDDEDASNARGPVSSASTNIMQPPPAKRQKGVRNNNSSGGAYAGYDDKAYVTHASSGFGFYPQSYGLAASGGSTTSAKRKRKLDELEGTTQVVRPHPQPIALPPPPVDEPCADEDGHFIVKTNIELGARYRISKLLGQGTFGKVVQCYDNQRRTNVAVKIIRAVQKYRDASKVEIRVLKLLKDRDPRNENKCIHLLDCFDYRNHICIVSELLSTSVFDFLKDNNYAPFPQSQIQSFARQLLGSVAFLHDLRLIHTDLKPENILLTSNECRPKTRHGQKRRILKSSSIRLIDFGSATFEDDYHANVVSTRHYRAPEIILGLGWSFPCDAWSIGCILIEFWTGEALFQTHENVEHLAMMEAVFGRMPTQFARSAARAKSEWFRSNRLDFPTTQTSRQSRKFVKAMRPLVEIVPPTSIVMSRFHDLLKRLLAWDPKDRISVREALKHPYFHLKIDDEGLEPFVTL